MTALPPPSYPGRFWMTDSGPNPRKTTGRRMTFYRNMMGHHNNVIEEQIRVPETRDTIHQLRIKTRFTDFENVCITWAFFLLLVCGICYHISAVFLSLSMEAPKERFDTKRFPKEYDFWVHSFFVFLGMILVPCTYL